jgi:hypothetical protein
VAAIPDAGGARRASRGVMRALSRVVVLGGLVVAGWLLGSGVGLANEAPGQPGTGLVQPVSDPSANDPSDSSAQSDGGSGGPLGMPPTVGSAVTTVRSAVWVPQWPVQSPEKLGVLEPLVNAVGVPKPLVHVLGPRVLAPQVLAPLSRFAKYGTGIRLPAPANKLPTVPPAEPAVRATAATAPVPTPERPTVLATVAHALPAGPTRAVAVPAANPFAGQSALGDDPAAPVPASPLGSTTSPCMTGSTGSGAGTKSAPDVAVNDSWASAGLPPIHRLRHLSASDLPRSLAAQPSTSPD